MLSLTFVFLCGYLWLLVLQFFLKATQLEQTKQDYVAAEESKRVAAEVMKQKEKVGYV